MKEFFKEDFKYYLIVGIIVHVLCFFFHFCVAEASPSNLPFVVNYGQGSLDSGTVAFLQDGLDNFNYDIDLYSDYVIIFFTGELGWYDYNNYISMPTYTIYKVANGGVLSDIDYYPSGTSYSSFELYSSSYYADVTFPLISSVTVKKRSLGTLYNGYEWTKTDYIGANQQLPVDSVKRCFGDYSFTIVNNQAGEFSFNSNYPVYISTPFKVNAGSTLDTIFTIDNSTVLPDLPPIDDIIPSIINPYTPVTPSYPSLDPNLPLIDNLEILINNAYGGLSSSIDNLAGHLEDWFQDVLDNFANGFNSVSSNIHNGFSTLTQTIKDFFKPILEAIDDKLSQILEKIAYIIEPVNTYEVLVGLTSTDFYQDFLSFESIESELSDLLDVEEPSEYKLLIHLEDIDNEYISLAGTQEIDISFLHNSTLFRTFCWCVVTCGLAFIVASGIPSMLRGDKGD